MRDSDAWRTVDISGPPVLVIGSRPRPKALQGWVIDTRDTAHGILRGVAQQALDDLAARDAVPWEPNMHAEIGEEYLSLDTSGLASSDCAAGGKTAFDDITGASALLWLLLRVPDLENLDADQLAQGQFTFYAVTFESGDEGKSISFVRKSDPTAVLRRANAWFRFQGALEPAPPADLVVDSRVDLVVTGGEIAILNTVAFDGLFADIRSLLANVPMVVGKLRRTMTSLTMTHRAQRSLEEFCRTRPSFARRLNQLANSEVTDTITPATLRTVLRSHGEDPNDYLSGGKLDIGINQVRGLLDVAEGRWYAADFTGERRRADRYRSR